MAKKTTLKVAMILTGALTVAGCDDTNLPGFLKKNSSSDGATATAGTTSRTVERDVEAPEVFQMSETGLWDGRPSLGGVWVAHSDAKDPERVIIRNEANGKFVIGALFRRERDVPGPRFQVSSDAAETLGMLAGNPVNLSVTALRKETVQPEPEIDDTPVPAPDALESGEISENTLDDPIAAASAALDRAEATAPSGAAAAKPTAKPAAKPAAKPVATPSKPSGLAKPYIQIGIFSVETNAKNTAEAMKRAGMLPTIKPGSTSGKSFWRVIVGPTTSSAERSSILKKVRDLGFADAYFVSH
ncbi:SPOR domain-containing protein [Aliiroseovarius crassostreae]|uniref:SPOR domain-containing protein n=1 Tax=Aliiroseovarius crassostreae TaxID=154981 RepID=UPI00220E8928|nr:SPOR domain-containing protein [Aliiroseovarius crassostreae]UWP90385.1 SPOR domain-containing protein [Aliiroseovarius crassostreae]